MIDYFLHLAKTGGTSFTHLIDTYYQESEIFPYKLWSELVPQLSNIDISHTKLIRGHFGYGIHHLFGRQNMRYFTLLRDPVDRVLSSYRHVTHNFENDKWSFNFEWRPINIMMYEYPSSFANCMIRDLADDTHYSQVPEKYPTYTSDESIKIYESMDWEQIYKRACNHLDTFIFVGFLENLQESFDKLCDIMDWKKQTIVHKNKLRPKVDPVLPQTIERIKEITYWDQKLVDYAKEKWLNK